MSSIPDDSKSDRLTLRLSRHDLDRLRDMAQRQNMDVASLAREAIRAYLDGTDPQAAQDRLTTELREAVREQADRVIARHEQTTRTLINQLNHNLEGKR